ncbi:MAG: hypothetical protein MO852_13255 [Candidatus Devosia euplotis]|nr:hypothetical protein [Candidatus Devosia euplotis]
MARARFEICLDVVLQHESGYADHPSDPGGATNLGITRKTLARWRQVSPWRALAKADVQGLQRSEAARIYRAGYWRPVKADLMPPGIDLALFDFAVNSGPDRAIRTLQGALGVRIDDAIDLLTLSAIKTRIAREGAAGLIDALCDRRLSFLARLSNFAAFGKGWLARVAAIRQAARTAAGASSTSSTPTKRSTIMGILNGYKTYLTAAIMLLTELTQMLGIDLPVLDNGSAGHLIMEALAVIFLRKGLKWNIGRA